MMNGLGLGNIFGSQANQNNQASQGSIQNLPAQLGQGMWITTSSGGTGITAQPQIISGQMQTDVALIKYILQRTVSNYDELVTQFNAIEDIKGAEQWGR